MEIDRFKKNTETLDAELDWLESLIAARFKNYFSEKDGFLDVFEMDAPGLDGTTFYGSLVEHYQMSLPERMILILALCSELRPGILDIFFTKNTQFERGFTEFGGIKGEQFGGFLPTGETAAFIAGGDNLGFRLYIRQILNTEHYLNRHQILDMKTAPENEPVLSGALVPTEETRHRLFYGTEYRPAFNHSFPAEKLKTRLDWDDLVLPASVLEELNEIIHWLEHQQTILHKWNLGKHLKPGYRSLFYGPPGTGKTLAAGLIGKKTGYDVYRIDLSKVVSKYIGETEKNLSGIFDRAEHRNWVLFFDEADALFGRRTQTKTSNDRYSNQEISYLLQRIEEFNGLVILATNLKDNIDEAFARRFQSTVHFPVPDEDGRLKLWENILGDKIPLDEDVELGQISKVYTLSGGSILNVVRYGALQAVRRENGQNFVRHNDLLDGIKRELKKYGKSML